MEKSKRHIIGIYSDWGKNRNVGIVRNRVGRMISGLKGATLKKTIAGLLSHPISKICFKTCGFDTKDLSSRTDLIIENNEGWEMWHSELFKRSKTMLVDFLSLKQDFEAKYLTNDIGMAKSILVEIEKLFGATLWGVLSRILLESVGEGTGRASAYCKQIAQVNNEGIIEYLTGKMLLKVEVKSVTAFTGGMNDVFQDVRGSKQPHYADFFSGTLLPLGHDKNRILQNGFQVLSRFPVIDQYIYHRRAVLEMFANNEVRDPEAQGILDRKTKYSPECLEILNQYTKGNYSQCIEKIVELWKDNPCETQYLEIFSKSCAYSGIVVSSGSNVLDEIISAFISIVKLESECSFKIGFVENILVKNCHLDWTLPVLAQLHNLFRFNDENIGKKYAKMCCYGETPTTPKYVIIASDCEGRRDFCKETVDLLSKAYPIVDVSEARALKYKIQNAINKSNAAECEVLISEAFALKHLMLPLEFFELVSDLLFKVGEDNKIFEFVAHSCMNNIEVCRCVPIKECVEKIYNENAKAKNILLMPIICHAYVSKINKSAHYILRDVFDDCIELFCDHRPSVIFGEKEHLTEIEIYFLRYVCMPTVMDICSGFGESVDVLSERIQIIDLLTRHGQKDKELLKERGSLVDNIVIEKGMAGYDRSRVFVDLDGLLRSRKEEYRSLYDLYHSCENTSTEFIRFLGSESKFALPANEKDKILFDFIIKFLKEFVRSQDYGLERSLSADIRHGNFSNQIRSRFESLHLVTSMGVNGEYMSNLHWSVEYKHLSYWVRSSLDSILSTFSKQFDATLKVASEWMKTTFEGDDTSHLFNYSLSIEKFNYVRTCLSRADDFDGFMSELELYCLEVTKDCLSTIRTKLNEEFVRDVNSSLDELVASLEKVGVNYPFHALLSSVSSARNALREDVNTVCEWLKISESFDFGEHQLGTLLEISKKCFLATKSNINIEFNGPSTPILFGHRLTDRESRAMITALITAFDNAVRHGTHTTIPMIFIDCDSDYDSFCIRVSNPFIPAVDVDAGELLNELENKIDSFGNNELMFSEGGTGVYKINNLLNMSSSRFFVKVNFENKMFALEINGVFHGSFTN